MLTHEHDTVHAHDNVYEHDGVQEAVAIDHAFRTAGEDVGETFDRSEPEPQSRASNAAGESFLDDSASATPAAARTHATLLADAKRYRKRAQAAEKMAEDLKADLAAREQKFLEQEKSMALMQRRQELDRLLREANAIDLDATRTLAEAAIDAVPEPDPAAAVNELRRTKPYLFTDSVFNRKLNYGSGAMSASTADAMTPRDVALHGAAAEARETGKRSDLLRYLRLRRKT